MTSWISKALVTATAAVTVVGAVALLLHSTGQPPEGPVDVAWDHDVCAECRMHVGDPRFAAQLHTTDGEVHHFDDPGCALRFVERERPDVHAVYYHHLHEDRWLGADEAGFVAVEPTPMGYGIGAVERGTGGSFGAAEARERALGHSEAMQAGAER